MNEAKRKAKIALLERRMTLSDLAEDSRLAATTIHNVLNGRTSSRKSRQAITDVLGRKIWEDVPVSARHFVFPAGMQIVFGTSEEATALARKFATEVGPGRATVNGNRLHLLASTRAIISFAIGDGDVQQRNSGGPENAAS